MSRRPQRVAIVDPTPMIRRGLREFLESTPGLAPGFEAAHPAEALARCSIDPPDLLLSEFAFPGHEGIFEFLRELRMRASAVPVLVFSAFDERLMAHRVLRAGALGYLMKSADEAQLRQAIRRVLGGHPYLSREMTDLSLDRLAEHPGRALDLRSIADLTNREIEVLERVGAGLTSKEIAESLHISLKTVETHRAHIRAKLGIDHGAGLVSYASRWRALSGAQDLALPPGAGI